MLSYILFGNGLGFWKTIPIDSLNLTTSILLSIISLSSILIDPSILQISITSFILLMHLIKVDFPQPDGPINAVTSLLWMSKFTLNNACFFP